MTEAEFDVMYPMYRGVMRAIARKLVLSDDDLLKDVLQEMSFRFYQLDLTRAKVNMDSWIRQAMKYAAIDALRALDPQRYVSLEARLEAGMQLMLDDAGMPILQDPPFPDWCDGPPEEQDEEG